jgi:hypothetical protein
VFTIKPNFRYKDDVHDSRFRPGPLFFGRETLHSVPQLVVSPFEVVVKSDGALGWRSVACSPADDTKILLVFIPRIRPPHQVTSTSAQGIRKKLYTLTFIEPVKADPVTDMAFNLTITNCSSGAQ